MSSLRAVSFDFWNTLYVGATSAERVARRRVALRDLLARAGCTLGDDELTELYRQSAAEADRWWREEQRGYSTADRIHWLLERAGVARPRGCEHVVACARLVDDTLVECPPPLLPGAAETIRALAARLPLAVVSDTGFASGRAQDRLLARDGLDSYFAVRVYSMDVGRAKPHRAMFDAAVAALAVRPHEVLHVGDSERCDVRGALAAGLRAVRLDALRCDGPSDAEFVAQSLAELQQYLLEQTATTNV